jgi:hypothetical protein
VLSIWAYRKFRKYREEMIAVGINLAASGIILVVSALVEQWSQAWIAIGGALVATIVFLVARWIVGQKNSAQDAQASSAAKSMGLVGYWRDYERAFKDSTGKDFGAYVRDMVAHSTGVIRVIGVDWTELFGAAISGTSEYYDSLLRDSKRTLRVILHDPRSLAGMHKRHAEFLFEPNGVPRYVPNHPDRIYGKILGSTQILADYALRFPKHVDIRFTRYLPDFCAVITDERIICYPYVRNLKGWDSPVFMLEPGAGGLYETVAEYFEYCWTNLDTDLSAAEAATWRTRLARVWTDFEDVINHARRDGDSRAPMTWNGIADPGETPTEARREVE